MVLFSYKYIPRKVHIEHFRSKINLGFNYHFYAFLILGQGRGKNFETIAQTEFLKFYYAFALGILGISL